MAPFLVRLLTSFIHEELEDLALGSSFDENVPKEVRCVHPLVTLLGEMIRTRDIKKSCTEDGPCFSLSDDRRRRELEEAWVAIQHMFWGKRVSLTAACESICSFLRNLNNPDLLE